MALKDWKKTRYVHDKNDTWIDYTNKNTGSKVHIFRYAKNNWSINVNSSILEREVKTKSQALKFAKSYMRKH
jgi:hypothetical protein